MSQRHVKGPVKCSMHKRKAHNVSQGERANISITVVLSGGFLAEAELEANCWIETPDARKVTLQLDHATLMNLHKSIGELIQGQIMKPVS